TQNNDLQAKVDEAAPFFKLKDEERMQKEEEAKAAEEKRLAEKKAKQEEEAKAAEEKRLAEEKVKQEEEAKAKAEAEAKIKQGYDTGITYNQLARTPDEYTGEKVKFRGKVVQVMEGDGETQIRLAVSDDYDTIIFGAFDTSIISSRVLEDDMITIYGTSTGLITYDSTMGGQISIPGVIIDKIDQ
uniref:toxin regulator n=1 Tax=Bacillus sp. FJAT-45037 TaxID=2011007 RepID=UPI000C230733